METVRGAWNAGMGEPETRKGKRTELAKQYNTPEIWHVKCPVIGNWIVAAGCNKACCSDHIGERMEKERLIIECQAA